MKHVSSSITMLAGAIVLFIISMIMMGISIYNEDEPPCTVPTDTLLQHKLKLYEEYYLAAESYIDILVPESMWEDSSTNDVRKTYCEKMYALSTFVSNNN